MLPLEFSRARVKAFLEEIVRLKASDFPYPHSEQALSLIERVFSAFLSRLETLDEESDPETVRAACAAAVSGLFEYLPILGFILRSTNVRNAFEMYGPLLRLCRKILGPSTKLLLSSEWEYSPFTYAEVTHLPSFVLIGLPAHDSANPLLLPLAGHELGHTIWADRDVLSRFSQRIQKAVIDAILGRRWKEYRLLHPDVKDKSAVTDDFLTKQTWLAATHWAERQVEETFCDMIGLRVFGESYFYAFAYLLSPRLVGARSVIYPNFRRRVNNLIKAGQSYGYSAPAQYVELFEDLREPPDYERNKKFLLSLADLASETLTPEVINLADSIVSSARVPVPSNDKAAEIYQDFELLAPAHRAGGLANILNAGWRAFYDKDLWSTIPQIRSRTGVLRALLLKSIEVLEYEEILSTRTRSRRRKPRKNRSRTQ